MFHLLPVYGIVHFIEMSDFAEAWFPHVLPCHLGIFAQHTQILSFDWTTSISKTTMISVGCWQQPSQHTLFRCSILYFLLFILPQEKYHTSVSRRLAVSNPLHRCQNWLAGILWIANNKANWVLEGNTFQSSKIMVTKFEWQNECNNLAFQSQNGLSTAEFCGYIMHVFCIKY